MNGRALAVGAISAALASAGPSGELGPFETNHPRVEAGAKAYAEGRYDDALADFEAARKEVPDSAAADFNAGTALYKLGRFSEAREAFQRAAQAASGTLRQKDYYNLGNALAQLGEEKAAIGAYRKALTLDPSDEQARHNLEVLLRKIPPKQTSPDGGADGGDAGPRDGGSDGGSPDGGGDGGSRRDGGQDGGGRDAGGQDGGARDGGADGGGADGGGRDGGRPERGDGGTADGGRGDAGESRSDRGRDGGMDAGSLAGLDDQSRADAGAAGEISRVEAERLLESMKRNEKNLQLWRFQQRQKQRKTDEKDW
ncbi:MAG TPA: tetratricopeptide repeat protein [Myxococcaceae bacterium]|nr:tetratricopeptide repeat protein [Myxococcaceae bacterium]